MAARAFAVLRFAGSGRRELLRAALAVIAMAAAAAPIGASAQRTGKLARVGMLVPSTVAGWSAQVQVFRNRLRELGWSEGGNLVLDIRYADDRYERLPVLAAALAAARPDVIVTGASEAARAAARATTTIPIVFETLGDALNLGLVTNLARPEANLTGVSGFSPEQSMKRLELLRQIAPAAKRVAVLGNRGNIATRPVVEALESAARSLRIELDVVDVRDSSQIERAFSEMAQRQTDGFVLAADPMLFGQRRRIVELAARNKLPAAYELRMFAESGGLFSFGPHPTERFERMAVYVDRILRGAKPADLPIERPTKFELVVNLKTAKALGLSIPQAVLVQADELIR